MSSSSYYGDGELRIIGLQTRFFRHKNTITGGRILANPTFVRFHNLFSMILSKSNRTVHIESCDGALDSCGEHILHYTNGRSKHMFCIFWSPFTQESHNNTKHHCRNWHTSSYRWSMIVLTNHHVGIDTLFCTVHVEIAPHCATDDTIYFLRSTLTLT